MTNSPLALRDSTESRWAFFWLAALAPVVLLVHGYHPFADDAGLYVTGVRKLLDPALYRPDAAFVLAMTHLSVFAHLLAEVIRLTHLPLTWVLLLAHLLSIYLFLLAAWVVARALFAREAERWFAVLFAAACFTLPAAGTALVVMDPYVTARSFSTPLGLFAVAAVLRRRWGWAALLLVLTALMHPLMAVYAAAFVTLYALVDMGYTRGAVLLGAAGVAGVGLLWLATRGASVSPAYAQAIHSDVRTFLFPAQWTWYEDLGLVVPLMLFALGSYRAGRESRVGTVCMACVVLGVSAIVAAFLFVHASGPFLVARLQILRSFHVLYALGVLLAGGWLGEVLWRAKKTRWVLVALLVAVAGGLFAAQRATFPDSAHVEWPWAQPRNPWARAFVWIRGNTPADAVFAANPRLAFLDGVDAQGFRATAERSILANDKDQGVVAVMEPSLTAEWATQRNAQIRVDAMTDAERERRLRPFGVTWLLLRADSVTGFECPYRNGVAKVCVFGK